MDDCLLDEIMGINRFDKLNEEIYIPETDLYFTNYNNLLDYLEDNIYKLNEFYILEIEHLNFITKLYFRDKSRLISYFNYKYKLQDLENLYFDFIESEKLIN